MEERLVSKRPLQWIAILMMFGLVAGACSNGSTGKSAAVKKGDAAGGLYPISALNKAQHTGTPKEGGTVKFGMESAVLNVSPNQSVIQPSDLAVATSVFDALTTFDTKGEPVGQLAKSVVGSNNFKTWTVTLKSNLKFSNGVGLDAGQVDSHTKWLAASPSCSCATDIGNIASTSMPDGPAGLTYVYNLNAPNVAWPTKLASALGWITESGARATAQNQATPTTDNLVGTGPFMFQPGTGAGSVYTVVKNPYYYGTDPQNNNAKLPYLDKIIFQPLADATTRLQAVQSNSVQIMQTADTSNLVGAKADPNLVVQPITGSSSTILVLNLTKPPFGVTPTNGQSDAQAAVAALSDPKAKDARMAFATGINRNEINQKYYKGTRVPAYSFIPPTSPYYDPKGQLPHYNLVKAKSMVAKLTSEGDKPIINAICIPTPESTAVFTILQQQGLASGITSNMKSVDQAVLVQTLLLGKSTTATANWNVACFRAPQISDPDDVYNTLYSKGSTNLVHYDNPLVDKNLNLGRTVEGIATRKPYYDIVQEQVANDKPYIPLLFDYYGNVYQKSLSGLGTPRPDNLGTIPLATLFYKK